MENEKAKACIRILEELYGVPEVEDIDPVDLLVMTILSQNTSDTNSLRAFAQLKSVYGDYEEILAAKEEDVADVIRSGGLADIKARRIKETLQKIKTDVGAIALGFLADLDKNEAREYLLSLPGVGPKTTAVVLLFAFGLPFMPVDTHVYRISRRLGMVAKEANIEMAERILEEMVPPEKYLSMHLNLLKHGRRICRARGPSHEECALRHYCDCYLRGTSLK